MSYATLDEAFGTEFKFQNCNKKKQRKKINCNKNKTKFSENTEDSDIDLENLKTSNSMSFETFSNYNPNEIFEYSEDENKEITDEQNLLVHEKSDNLSEQNKLENKKKNKKNKNSVKQNNNSEKNHQFNEINNSEQNHQFNEINNKINFLINQVNEKANIVGDDDSESNIHDLILFILFGVFVILILEALYKLVVELCKYKMFNK